MNLKRASPQGIAAELPFLVTRHPRPAERIAGGCICPSTVDLSEVQVGCLESEVRVMI